MLLPRCGVVRLERVVEDVVTNNRDHVQSNMSLTGGRSLVVAFGLSSLVAEGDGDGAEEVMPSATMLRTSSAAVVESEEDEEGEQVEEGEGGQEGDVLCDDVGDLARRRYGESSSLSRTRSCCLVVSRFTFAVVGSMGR